MKSVWKFADEPNVAVITTKKILDGHDQVNFVSHDADDGMWQFLPGTEVNESDAAVVSLATVVRTDTTLEDLQIRHVGGSLKGME